MCSPDDRAIQLPAPLASALRLCTGFKTLRQHALYLVEATSLPGAAAELEAALAKLAREGFLLSERELIAASRRRARASPSPGARIDTLAMVTRDRVGLLRRGLTSFLENLAAAGRSGSVVVGDDSRSREAQEACASMLRALGRERRVEIRYAGLNEKKRYARRLARVAGCPPELVEFALLGPEGRPPTHGANRNGLLLDCAGEAFLSVDDDVVCRLARPRGAVEGLELSASPASIQTWAASEARELEEVACRTDADLLGLHEQLLGRTVAECVAASAEGSLEVVELTPELVEQVRSGQGHVAVTCSGNLGDSAHARPTHLLWLSGEPRHRLLRSRAHFEACCRGRQVLHVTPRLAIAPPAPFIGNAAAFDNRALLPPFVPTQRGEELGFAHVLSLCSPGASLGFIPCAISHQPEPRRTSRVSELWSWLPRRPLYKLLSAVLSTFDLRARGLSPRERLRAVGRHLVALTQLDARELEGIVRQQVLKQTVAETEWIEQWLRDHRHRPTFWAQAVRRVLEGMRRSMLDPDVVLPEGWPRGAFQGLVSSYGQLLVAWPDLLDAARTLRARGARLSRAL
jgi:hypothetical protein